MYIRMYVYIHMYIRYVNIHSRIYIRYSHTLPMPYPQPHHILLQYMCGRARDGAWAAGGDVGCKNYENILNNILTPYPCLIPMPHPQ